MTWDVVRDPIQALIDEGLAALDLTESEPGLAEFGLPERRAFGEITTTFAFRAAKKRKKAPRIIAEELVRGFRAPEGSLVADAKTEGAGYVNLFARRDLFGTLVINSILALGSAYGEPETPFGYDLATLFHRFYGSCPVLSAAQATRHMRLGLVKAVSVTLENLLRLLGIPLVEGI